MSFDPSKYPANWKVFSAGIRSARAHGQCECTGECGQHHARRCVEINHSKARWFVGKVTLTVAHLCNCYPICDKAEHCKAMCQKCHLRTDRFRHAAARLGTQSQPGYWAAKLRKLGQAHGIEALELLATLPKRKRTRIWRGQ